MISILIFRFIRWRVFFWQKFLLKFIESTITKWTRAFIDNLLSYTAIFATTTAIRTQLDEFIDPILWLLPQLVLFFETFHCFI